MGPKKRKVSESRDDERSAVTSGKKRKRTEIDYAELIQELYETVRNHKSDEGKLLCEEFIRAPKRRTDPEYHNVVTNPIDLQKIHQKLKSDEYNNLDEFAADIKLLVDNSRAYYKEDSQEYQDATELWELFVESKTVLLGEELGNYDGEDAFEDDEEEDDDDDDDEEDEEEDEDDEAYEGSNSEKMDIEPSESGRSLRERRYTYRDFLFPKVVISERQKQIVKQKKKLRRSSRLLRPKKRIKPLVLPKKRRKSHKEDAPPPPPKDVATADDKDDQGSVAGDDDDSVIEQLFTAVVTATENGRCVSDMFKVLPSRKKYPDYYEIITEPMDLKTIAQRITSSYYKTLDDLANDIHQMVSNAKMFNEPGSQIYRDAMFLRKLVQVKKHDLEQQPPVSRPVRSQRIRSRKANAAANKLSSVIAALESDSDREDVKVEPPVVPEVVEYESGEDDSITETTDDPLWVLYRAVKVHKNSLGQRLSEPFLRMPSKRIYPDYYAEIKKPMSLLKIQKKLKNAQYRDLDHMIGDLELVFDNAKQYNIDESKLYKDAVKLVSIMRAKAKEIKSCKKPRPKTVATKSPKSVSSKSPCLNEPLVYSAKPKLDIVGPPIPLEDILKEELEQAESSVRPGKGRRSLEAGSNVSEDGKRKLGRKSMSPEELLRKRLWNIFRVVYDYAFDGRPLINIFVQLPSKKDYPDYYQVISEPIDMTMIENKIKLEKYTTEKALIADLELMFNNARHYNEENSQVYKDAEKLERILLSKVRSMPAIDSAGIVKTPGKNKPKTKSNTTLAAKLQDLYNTIRDYSDPRKRVLSTPFMKLPLKSEYPDYYEVIKRPIDMQKVFQRLISNQYPTIEEMVADIVLMFDNACKYNEPDSLIYKDALSLQRVCLEKKAELCADDYVNEVPDVQGNVSELMKNLFISTFNHTDEEGRCYSDSFMELPSKIPGEESEAGDEKERPAPNFELIKRNMDKGRYRRMDRFQQDMFEVFKFARQVSRTDSQVYEDSIELQMFFIRIRDELCKNGDFLLTPALSYRETHLHKDLDKERKEKAPREQREDEEKKKQPGGDDDNEDSSTEQLQPGKTDKIDFKEQTFVVGDFVYIEPRDKGLVDPHIVCIERMWKEDTGEQWLYGCWFLRPKETYHLATRKFLEKELFKSDFYDSVPFGKVLGKCHVMSVRDYFKMKPEGFADRDVYVCESRYSGRTKAFKKIKNWQLPKNDALKLVPRDHPLSQIRVTSVFSEKASSEDRRDIDDGLTHILEKAREEVILEGAAGEEGYIVYEQIQTPACWIKVGDHVYVKTEIEDKTRIMGIDKIWKDANGELFLHGALFYPPSDVEHPPTRLFYAREVFRSSTEQTSSSADIVGRCHVLNHKEYMTGRPTEVAETDIFICEAKYIESERVIKKFLKPMKRPALSVKVLDDEILFFRKAIVPHKEPSPLLLKASEETILADVDGNTMDSTYSDTTSAIGETSLHDTPSSEPVSEKKKKNKNKSRNITGYIMFAAEYRKEIAAENPDMSFGEISKIVGTKWKSLEQEVKVKFEEKAKMNMAENLSKQAEADRAFNESLNQYPPANGADGMSPGGVPQTNGFHGFLGQNPLPGQQGMPPFPMPGFPGMPGNLAPGQGALNRHGYPGPPMPPGTQMTPLQFNNGSLPQMIYPNTPNNNLAAGVWSKLGPMRVVMVDCCGRPQFRLICGQNSQGQNMPPPRPPKPPSPMFVPVPPKTQRLVHSEAYLRYIENLSADSRTVGNWDRSLAATPDNTPLPTNTKLPVHWLANGVGHHDTAANALWALRDLMLKDAQTISRTLEFKQL